MKIDKYRLIVAEKDTFTFANDGSITEVDVAVTLVGPGQVGLGNDGDPLFGKVLYVEGDVVTVQMGGMTVFDFASAPSVGFTYLSVDGNGKAKTDTSGRQAFVIDTESGSNMAAVRI